MTQTRIKLISTPKNALSRGKLADILVISALVRDGVGEE